jgi:hypothetical protein
VPPRADGARSLTRCSADTTGVEEERREGGLAGRTGGPRCLLLGADG